MLEASPAEDPFARTLRTRRTINDFRVELPPEDLILQAIELARWAPNHKMTEPWRFYLLGEQTASQLIQINTALLTSQKGADAARKKADKWSRIPGWMVVTCQSSPDPVRDQENYAAVCCAIENLMLFLWSREIGTKWSTNIFLQHPDVAQLLKIDPAVERIVGLVWYGYPATIPEARRKPISEITTSYP
ncbi:nitroreductase family protein [Planctomicrobium sp. SH661]|uniref:nitroreductase family protein n=1 Tax=Planctomicrobium sp. SH661 TaxID=3448124 RepID=UPI003F5C8AB0